MGVIPARQDGSERVRGAATWAVAGVVFAVAVAGPARAQHAGGTLRRVGPAPKPTRARTPAPAATRVVLPANAPPVLSITSLDPNLRAAETRLAQFLSALQRNRRDRAARLLSSRVSARNRRALRDGVWLRKSPQRVRDISQILYYPDLQLRATAKRYGNVLLVAAMPRVLRKGQKGFRAGYVEVPMRYERGDWWVELRR